MSERDATGVPGSLTPEERAAQLVRPGPELTGVASPSCWWVYLGDHVICDLRCTEAEATAIAVSYHPTIAAAIRAAVAAER